MNEESTGLQRPQYRDKFWLMNKSEHLLYTRLVETVPAMLVFSQVSMSQLFHINAFRDNGFLQLNEIGKKSVDFLICRANTSIVLAIELNGPTHERETQKAKDEKKRIALEEAGIPLIVLDPACIPEVPELRKLLAPHMVERRKHEATRDERMQTHFVEKRKVIAAPPAQVPATASDTPTEIATKKKFWFKRKAKSP